MLISRGASVNPNIFIPNDGDSVDKSVQASNRDDGTDSSQYRWGLITPLRLVLTFEHSEVTDVLRLYKGDAGGIVDIICNGDALPVTLTLGFGDCNCHRHGLRRLPPLPDGSCWVRQSIHDEIYYMNTSMEAGNRGNTCPHVLFSSDLYTSRLILLGCGRSL